MSKGIIISKNTARVFVLTACIGAICFMLACTPPPATQPDLPLSPLPVSPWGDNYAYRYEPPEKRAPASVRATIVVVNPSYREAESALIDPTYSKVGKGFSTSMGVDMDKIVIAKGMTVKGPYGSLDEVTYSDKKGSDLTLAPKVFITTQVKYTSELKAERFRNDAGKTENRVIREFEMKIGGWIAFVMQEPLSGEKMWIKKLELEDMKMFGVELFEAVPQYTTYRYGFFNDLVGTKVSGYTTGKLVYDGKIDAMADALKKIYPTIMQKCWTYIDADEVLSLKEKVKEIRELKRY